MKSFDIKSFSLALLLMGPPINYYLNTVLQYGFGLPTISAFAYVFMAVVGAYSYRYVKQIDRAGVIIFTLLVIGLPLAALLGGFNMVISPDLNPLDSPLLLVFLYCFPLYILTSTINDFGKAFDYLYYFAIFNIVLFIPSYYYSQLSLSALRVDYMSISYNVLIAICVCLGVSWDKKKWLPAIIAIASILLLIVVGSRGASLSVLIYIVLLLITKLIGGEKKMVFVISAIAVVAVLALGSYYYHEVTSLIDSGEMYSRNLSKLDDSSFFSHDDRNEIKTVIERGIDSNPFGYGLLGDRIIMQNEHYEGVYAHNILLELRADFGILLGPAIFILLLLKMFVSYRRLDGYRKDFLVMLIPAGFIKLLFSGSFLIEPAFYCLLALVFCKENGKKIKMLRN